MSQSSLEEPVTDETLLDEARYREYMRAGRLYLFRHGVRDLADCEDLLHEALPRALKAWRPERGTTLAAFFIHVVLRNEMLNWFRARKSHPVRELTESEPASGESVERLYARTKTARVVSSFRDALPEQDRAVLDCAVSLLGSLQTTATARGEPHNFASRGAAALSMTRYKFLAAWERIRDELRRLLREVSDE